MGLKSLFGSFVGKKGGDTATLASTPAEKTVLLAKIRQSELFKALPASNLEILFASMETVAVRNGEEIIREGAEGDYFYLLAKGTGKVMRRPSEGAEPVEVATIDEPKGFGEEALISNAKRNATIIMTSDGVVMRLSKDAFNDHVRDPLLDWYSAAQAQDKAAKGAKWLDIRSAGGSSSQARLHGAIAIPIEELRQRLGELQKEVLYICYCENGRQSASAAFILRQSGYQAGVLRGGLQSLKRAV